MAEIWIAESAGVGLQIQALRKKQEIPQPGATTFIFQFSIRRGNTTPENAACVGVVCLNDPFYLGKVESGLLRVGKGWRNPARTKGGWRSRRTMDE